MVRIGVIGVGSMGTNHVNRIQKEEVKRCKLTAVCDIDPKQMEGIEDVVKFTDSAELIRSGEVDAVMIATPHYGHTTIGADALEQGLHVLVEKPISVHKADCERLIAAHKGDGQVFAAMFNQRTDKNYQKIKALIERGELGEIQRVNWIITSWFRSQAYYNSGGWRATWEGEGGGVLLNQCPHNLDLFQWLFGMPSSVRATCSLGKYHDIEVEDEVTAYFEYPNGATGLFITSTGEMPGTNRLEVTGDRGKLVNENGKLTFTRNEIPTREFCETSQNKFGKADSWNIEVPVKGKGGMHNEITQNFVDAILDGVKLLAPAAEGINSVEIANGMLFSSARNETIAFPIDAAAYEAHLMKLIADSTFEKKTAEVKDEDMGASFNA